MKEQRDILLISKDRNLRNAGAGMLEAAGYSVHTASSMRDALGILSSEPVGLIVCGLELEDILATDFLAYLKNDPLRENIPFVFYIHNQHQVDLPPKEAMDLGADDVILYPVGAGEFIRRVGKVLPSPSGSEYGEPDKAAASPKSSLPKKEQDANAGQAKTKAENGDIQVSLDGKRWEECQVINHTFHGIMVETRLRGKQGNTVRLRYEMPDGPLTAKGRLMHILLGDHERPMGMGINFRGDANWRRIHAHMKAPAAAEAPSIPAPTQAPPPVVEPAPPAAEENLLDRPVTPETPIGIEVSRDASLWMYGEITEYDGAGAAITTPVLGKSGETLHIRFTTPHAQKILKARIKQVTLNDFKMPAGMQIIFPEKDPWLDMATGFAGEKSAGPSGESAPEAPPAAPADAAEKAEAKKPDWTDTVVDARDTSKAENIKHRFYKSLIGKKLGNYEIVSFLDAGSMGGVFKGWDIALERDVAIKVISYELSAQEEFVEMFFKEARLVSKLNHPNIAHIYFIGNETGIVYYTMEFIHGSTLAELMAASSRIQADKAVAYLAAACRALDRVWQEKIIHRDIKPANIMISEHETVKLLDFGVAQQQKKGAVREKKNIVGSPAYLSPETIREEPVDFRSDIYSLGATFYHVLCGSPPFTDDSLEGMLRKHLEMPPVPLKEKLPDLAAPVSDVVQKMLAKSPEDRFQSYQEIISALSPAITPLAQDATIF